VAIMWLKIATKKIKMCEIAEYIWRDMKAINAK
jgi:hypothetical protein